MGAVLIFTGRNTEQEREMLKEIDKDLSVPDLFEKPLPSLYVCNACGAGGSRSDECEACRAGMLSPSYQ